MVGIAVRKVVTVRLEPRVCVLVQPEIERRCLPLVSVPPSAGDFQGIDTTTRLSLSMVAFPQSPLPFRPARSL